MSNNQMPEWMKEQARQLGVEITHDKKPSFWSKVKAFFTGGSAYDPVTRASLPTLAEKRAYDAHVKIIDSKKI